MKILKGNINSVRSRLFLTLCIAVIVIVVFLIITNSFVLEQFYLFSKQKTLMIAFEKINHFYSNKPENIDIELELEKISINNNFDILIKTEKNINVYYSNRDFLSSLGSTIYELDPDTSKDEDVLYTRRNILIKKTMDTKNGLSYVVLSSTLDNGYLLYIRMPISSIRESVAISNRFLFLMGGFTILIGGFAVLIISKRFTEPIVELNGIAKKMSHLDFSQKYNVTDTEDEINDLGRSINIMSDKLENVIKQLKTTNVELEKDIEEKSKIDEMRKQFISDVSHELKTPISLIEGYAEGLIENVATDEQSRRFYTEVILDETNKMGKLVKQLLELMKIEYGSRQFNNVKFNIVELIQEIVRKSKVVLEENQIKVIIENKEPIYVMADEFYVEQIITNYFTNAIKHVQEINKKKQIIIKCSLKNNRVRTSIFNTGEKIQEEDLNRIWTRFYKVDKSRNREDGGTGIGLSIVKAIMNNYEKEYGVLNKETGVEFYFDLDVANI